MLWIPPGRAHGFRVLSESAQVPYKATSFYYPECERTLAWNDPEVNVNWELRRKRSCPPKVLTIHLFGMRTSLRNSGTTDPGLAFCD